MKANVIGCGPWAQNHIRILSELDLLNGVYDLNKGLTAFCHELNSNNHIIRFFVMLSYVVCNYVKVLSVLLVWVLIEVK